MNRFPSIVALLVFCGTVFSGSTAVGQLTYDVSHSFVFTPPAGFPPIVPTVRGGYFEHAWIKEAGYQAWGAAPLPQGPAFEPFGMEQSTGTGAENQMPPAGPFTPVQFGSFTVPSPGLFTTGCVTITSPNSSLSASACTQFDVGPFGAGTPVSGMFRSAGGVIMGGIGRVQEAYAFSSAGLSIAGVSPTGQVLWHATMSSVSGSAHVLKVVHDPITVVATDAAGNSASAVALDIDFQNSGPGGVSWQSGVLTVDAPNSRFLIRMDARIAPRGGSLIIETQGNSVSLAVGTGMFANLPLPPIGAVVPFSLALANDIPVNYDANGILPGASNVTLDFLGGGSMPGKIGCAADFNDDGMVDFFDYLDFVDAFSSGLDSANFNHDETVDFFDYLDFVDAFSIGC